MTSQDGSTALVLAAQGNHKDTVELLLDRGASLEAKTKVRQAGLQRAGRRRASRADTEARCGSAGVAAYTRQGPTRSVGPDVFRGRAAMP